MKKEKNSPAPELQPDQETAEKAGQLSEKKRTAMLRYIAILFAVAFVLVLLSYLIQYSSNRTTIKELNATSVSALQNAEQLQETNRDLTEENRRLNDELDNANATVAEYHESVAAERQGAYKRGLDEATEATRAAYDLLLKAQAEKDPDELKKLLDELEPIKDNLSETALAQLEQLKKSL